LVEGSLSAAAFAIFVTLGLVFYRPMFDLIELVAYGRSLAGHVEAIAAVLAVAPLPSRGAATEAPSGSAVRFRDVSFAYGERHGGLRDVDIEAPEGKVTAIVGPSGAGKSTALSLLARFFDVERGAIELGGVDIRDLPLTDLYSRLSIVFQDPFLFRDTARANIALGRPGAADDDIVRAAVAAQIHETIAALPNGYDTVLGENGAPLSGGERQRLALARALLKDSEIVLLDEAVAAVDPDAKEDIRAALARLCAGKTVLVVSHDLSTAEHADHIVVLEAGRVVTQGRHAELLARGGLYARLWTIQANARSIAIRASEAITASAAQ
jgi:ATP-binding cassette subfamily B protein